MKKLKRISSFALWLFVSVISAQSQTVEELYSKATVLYNEKKYEEAVVVYNDILRSGYFSDEVYYNLGNACFRKNDAAGAIWCYEKCLLLNASHDDARVNLDYVNKIMLGNQEIVPENFFVYAWNSMYAFMSWRCWAYTFIILFVIFLSSFTAFLLSASRRYRRIFFIASVILIVLTLLSLAQSIIGNYNINHSENAIVLHEAVQMKSSPDQGGTAIAMIQHGVKVHILEVKNPWMKIITPDGMQGWVLEEGLVRLSAVSPISAE